MSFTIFDTGVLAFECSFSNLMSAAVNGLRAGLFFFALATLFLLKQGDYIARAVRSASKWRNNCPFRLEARKNNDAAATSPNCLTTQRRHLRQVRGDAHRRNDDAR